MIHSRYPSASWKTRTFLAARWRLTPYAELAARMPARGRILDLGCGHGLFSLALALGAQARRVLGVDHDPERVRLAREAAQGLEGLEFRQGSLLEPPPGPYDGIALIDVMHYFSESEQTAIVRRAREALVPGGIVLVREVDPSPGLVSFLNQAYESVATRIGFTRAERARLHFRPIPEWENLLAAEGLAAASQRCGSALFADWLISGSKT